MYLIYNPLEARVWAVLLSIIIYNNDMFILFMSMIFQRKKLSKLNITAHVLARERERELGFYIKKNYQIENVAKCM